MRLAPGDVPTLRVDNAKARESGTGADSTMRFTVRLAPAATSAVTVDYQTVEGWDYGETVSVPSHGRFVAREGADYRRTSGTLTFAPGDTVRTVSVPIVDDAVPDSGEVFTLVLANEDGAVLGDPVGRGTIRNDEALTAGFGALPSGHDGETAFTVGLAFSEEVAVSAAALAAALDVTGGSVTGARALDAGSTRSWEIDVAPSGAGDVTVALAPRADCAAPRAVCTADGVALEAAVEAVVAHAVEALPALEVAGVPQVGSALTARFAEAPDGTVAWQWLRGGAEIAGAEASTYTPVAADAGAALSVRAESGAAAVTSAATAPVWPAPANPPLAAGEEALLSAVLTLQRHTFGTWVAGYGRVLGQSFGELDRAAFEEDGTTREVSLFAVNPVGDFVLATGAALPEAAGLAAYWNGHRIGTLETGTAGGLAVLTGRMPEAAAAEYGRYMDGSSDGVRVAVSLRRAPATASATHGVSARVSGRSGRQRRLGRGRDGGGRGGVQRAGHGVRSRRGDAGGRGPARRRAARGGVYGRLGDGGARLRVRGDGGGCGRAQGAGRSGEPRAERRGHRGRRGARGRARLRGRAPCDLGVGRAGRRRCLEPGRDARGAGRVQRARQGHDRRVQALAAAACGRGDEDPRLCVRLAHRHAGVLDDVAGGRCGAVGPRGGGGQPARDRGDDRLGVVGPGGRARP